jgi:ribosomal protein L11 methyltransferase
MGWEPLPEVPGHVEPAGFDLIAANILARVHVALAADYRATLRPGGRLVVGGFTYDQEDVVQEALRDAGFRWIDREQEGDYLVLAFVAR